MSFNFPNRLAKESFSTGGRRRGDLRVNTAVPLHAITSGSRNDPSGERVYLHSYIYTYTTLDQREKEKEWEIYNNIDRDKCAYFGKTRGNGKREEKKRTSRFSSIKKPPATGFINLALPSRGDTNWPGARGLEMYTRASLRDLSTRSCRFPIYKLTFSERLLNNLP